MESVDYDLIMVTDSAIEFYNFTSEKREGLKMTERIRHTIKCDLSHHLDNHGRRTAAGGISTRMQHVSYSWERVKAAVE